VVKLQSQQITDFQNQLLGYYAAHGRHDLPWRHTTDAYHITVSEVMLQQTQVARVIPKYLEFLAAFPTVADLAGAELGDVLRAWQGLGYNRRAKYLWQAAQTIVADFGGQFPDSTEQLVGLPGIGKNTAGAIVTYAFNQPALFVETNIRTVIIHHFFTNTSAVSDKEILDVLAEVITDEPRIFYWAMMDYGSQLKTDGVRLNARSTQYIKQSPFAGSRRRVRGKILRLLAARAYQKSALLAAVSDERTEAVLQDLEREGMVTHRGETYLLT
jgi:A/G-specific adenine glycosylase